MTDIPHFALPFRFGSQGRALVTEQDSIDEIANCALAILLCPLGFRSDLPEFGISDPTFALQPLDLEQLSSAIELWEPRAQTVLGDVETADELIAQIETRVSVRTEE